MLLPLYPILTHLPTNRMGAPPDPTTRFSTVTSDHFSDILRWAREWGGGGERVGEVFSYRRKGVWMVGGASYQNYLSVTFYESLHHYLPTTVSATSSYH